MEESPLRPLRLAKLRPLGSAEGNTVSQKSQAVPEAIPISSSKSAVSSSKSVVLQPLKVPNDAAVQLRGSQRASVSQASDPQESNPFKQRMTHFDTASISNSSLKSEKSSMPLASASWNGELLSLDRLKEMRRICLALGPLIVRKRVLLLCRSSSKQPTQDIISSRIIDAFDSLVEAYSHFMVSVLVREAMRRVVLLKKFCGGIEEQIRNLRVPQDLLSSLKDHLLHWRQLQRLRTRFCRALPLAAFPSLASVHCTLHQITEHLLSRLIKFALSRVQDLATTEPEPAPVLSSYLQLVFQVASLVASADFEQPSSCATCLSHHHLHSSASMPQQAVSFTLSLYDLLGMLSEARARYYLQQKAGLDHEHVVGAVRSLFSGSPSAADVLSKHKPLLGRLPSVPHVLVGAKLSLKEALSELLLDVLLPRLGLVSPDTDDYSRAGAGIEFDCSRHLSAHIRSRSKEKFTVTSESTGVYISPSSHSVRTAASALMRFTQTAPAHDRAGGALVFRDRCRELSLGTTGCLLASYVNWAAHQLLLFPCSRTMQHMCALHSDLVQVRGTVSQNAPPAEHHLSAWTPLVCRAVEQLDLAIARLCDLLLHEFRKRAIAVWQSGARANLWHPKSQPKNASPQCESAVSELLDAGGKALVPLAPESRAYLVLALFEAACHGLLDLLTNPTPARINRHGVQQLSGDIACLQHWATHSPYLADRDRRLVSQCAALERCQAVVAFLAPTYAGPRLPCIPDAHVWMIVRASRRKRLHIHIKSKLKGKEKRKTMSLLDSTHRT